LLAKIKLHEVRPTAKLFGSYDYSLDTPKSTSPDMDSLCPQDRRHGYDQPAQLAALVKIKRAAMIP